jgi:hypothetical protein
MASVVFRLPSLQAPPCLQAEVIGNLVERGLSLPAGYLVFLYDKACNIAMTRTI